MLTYFLRYFLFSFFILIYCTLYAQPNPKLDVKWQINSKNDSEIWIRIKFRTDKPKTNLTTANFVINYDHVQLGFAKPDTSPVQNVDYIWQPGFKTGDSTLTSITKKSYDQMSLNIDLSGSGGVEIPTDTSFIPFVDIRFKIKNQTSNTFLTWAMEKRPKLKTFEDVYDSDFIAFDEGEGWEKPLIVKLK